jgi:hypothetical protein
MALYLLVSRGGEGTLQEVGDQFNELDAGQIRNQ